jgi:hypothetical protein
MAFRDHDGFKVTSDPRLRRPDGGKKRKGRNKGVRRRAIAHTGGYNEGLIWLRGR